MFLSTGGRHIAAMLVTHRHAAGECSARASMAQQALEHCRGFAELLPGQIHTTIADSCGKGAQHALERTRVSGLLATAAATTFGGEGLHGFFERSHSGPSCGGEHLRETIMFTERTKEAPLADGCSSCRRPVCIVGCTFGDGRNLRCLCSKLW